LQGLHATVFSRWGSSGVMRAGFFQIDTAFGDKEKNFEKVRSALKTADIDLLVLPEFFATGYQFASADEVEELAEPVGRGLTTEFLRDLCRERGMFIVAGLPERDGDSFYNSAVFVGPEGIVGVYRKTHLFYEENLYFTPGDTGFRVWDTKLGRIGIMICFDWFFPESMRTLALMGAEVVAHPSNLVLPHCPGAMPVRCLENRVYSITANRIGVERRKEGEPLRFIGRSLIVSPWGEVLASAPEDGEAMLFADIDSAEAKSKVLNAFNDLFKDRRPERYSVLTEAEKPSPRRL
jgi:predicted amidohydrolase